MSEEILKNPIINDVRTSFNNALNYALVAVPFVTNFAKNVIISSPNHIILTKQLVIRFDDRNINTFDLPTLKSIIESGFEIRYNNNIHLKLYIFDEKGYISSSNLTEGGFINNVELTVKIDNSNINKCKEIFYEIWDSPTTVALTIDEINRSMPKYEILRRQSKYKSNRKIIALEKRVVIGNLDIDKLIDEIFYSKSDFHERLNEIYESNKIREKVKRKIIKEYDTSIFYVHEGNDLRRKTLFYEFVYGYESGLAGTGLREEQFKSVFKHDAFKEVVEFILPESLGMEPWNLDDSDSFEDFCLGLFDFEIPQYSEAIPIRLASYFYPDSFFPIFKLNHLKKMCEILGLETDASTNGERLFIYNSFITKKMKAVPYDNYIKSSLAYQLVYTVELYNRLQAGESFSSIRESYNKKWIQKFIDKGRELLVKINTIKE